MAAPQRLSGGSLTPSAKPVDTFLTFDANSTPAAPAQPSKLPQVKRVTAFQAGGKNNVQGVNSAAELADALKPLSKLYDAGVEMYTSDQYRRGQNEILRAAANVNRDTITKGLAYAEDNRELSRENPIAGVLMDEANPFRQAGRVNQASQFVATLTPRLFEAEWSQRGGELSKLDPGDPAILQVKSRITNRLADMFQLDEFSPGFQQYVLPQINRSSEWLSAQQLKGHTAYQKNVGVRQASSVMTGLLFDPRTTPERWNAVLTQFGAQFGVTGEPQKMIQNALMQTVGDLQTIQGDLENPRRQQAAAALRTLMEMPSGVADQNGISIPVGQFYQNEILSESAEKTRDLATIRNGRVALAEDALDEALDQSTTLTMNPQQMAAQFAAFRADPAYADLSDAELWDKISNRSEAAQSFQEATFNQDSVEDFFTTQEFAIGSEWDEATANRTFRALIEDAPTKLKKELLNRWRALRSQKERDSGGEIDSTVLSTSLKNSTNAIVSTILPEGGLAMIQAANEAGIDIVDYINKLKPDEAAAIQRIRTYLQKQAANEIRRQTAEKGRFLKPEEQQEIFTDIQNKTLADDKLLKSFGINPEAPEPAPPAAPSPRAYSRSSKPEQKPEQKIEPLSFYTPGQAVPEAVLSTGKPVYGQKDTSDLLLQAANGKPIPANVKRAARASGMTTGEFLIKQADLLGLPIPDGMRQKVQKVARIEQGASESFASAAPVSIGPLAYASNALFNILTGTAPAAAATLPIPSAAQQLQVVPNTQYIATTGLGKSADGMTQTLHGIQGRNGYDKKHSWGNDHVHHGAPDQQTALALANFLKNNGVPITEFKPWGSVAPVHRDPGHYNGMSMDIPVGVEEHDRILRLIDTFYRSR